MGSYIYRLLGPTTSAKVRLVSGEIVVAHFCVYGYKPYSSSFFRTSRSPSERIWAMQDGAAEKRWKGVPAPEYVIYLPDAQQKAVSTKRLDLKGCDIHLGEHCPAVFYDARMDKMPVVGHLEGPAVNGVFQALEGPSR